MTASSRCPERRSGHCSAGSELSGLLDGGCCGVVIDEVACRDDYAVGAVDLAMGDRGYWFGQSRLVIGRGNELGSVDDGDDSVEPERRVGGDDLGDAEGVGCPAGFEHDQVAGGVIGQGSQRVGQLGGPLAAPAPIREFDPEVVGRFDQRRVEFQRTDIIHDRLDARVGGRTLE